MQFSEAQQELIDKSARHTDLLKHTVKLGLGITKRVVEVKRHTYIYSPPGLGKTFAVQEAANEAGIEMLKVQGAASMNAIITMLATALYATPDEQIVVWIDDCDMIFMDTESLSVMKGALDEDRNVMSWQKNLTVQINSYVQSSNQADHIKGKALESFRLPNSVGVDIPMDRVRFIITSNRALTQPGSAASTPRKMHEQAVRDRVNYHSIDMNAQQAWGWSAATLMRADFLGLTKEQKTELLLFMFEYWARLPGTSLRTVKDFASDILNSPNMYQDAWEMRLKLKKD